MLELTATLSPVPLAADAPADVTIEILMRNTGDAPVTVFTEAAGFHDGFEERGPRFECIGLRFPLTVWRSGVVAHGADWYAERRRRLEPGAAATRSIAGCWIPRRFVSPDGATSWIAFNHSAKWAQQFRGRAPDLLHSKSTWILFDRPGRNELRFEYIQNESDVDLLQLDASLRVVGRALVFEIP